MFFRVTAQNTGAVNPSLSFTTPASSCTTCAGAIWANENNANAGDGVFTTATLKNYLNCFQSTCYLSRYLNCTSFGFSIPANSNIVGIKLRTKGKASANNSITDSTIKMGVGGVMYGTNHAQQGTYWGTGNSYTTYGGTTDSWGYTWLPSNINDPTFGVFIKVMNASNADATASIDHVQITIYYSVTTGEVLSQTASPSVFNVSYDDNAQRIGITFDADESWSSVQVFNIFGEKVYARDIEPYQSGIITEHISSSALQTGIYFVSILAPGRQFTKKVVVR